MVPLGDDQPVRQTLVRGAHRPEGEARGGASALIAVPHPNLIGQHCGDRWSMGAEGMGTDHCATLPSLVINGEEQTQGLADRGI